MINHIERSAVCAPLSDGCFRVGSKAAGGGRHDFDDIVNAALVATREFYDAENVVIANTDVNLQIAGSFMREFPREDIHRPPEKDSVYLKNYPMFLEAIKRDDPIICTDIVDCFPTDSIEYKRLQNEKVHSFIAVTYGNQDCAMP